MKVSIEKNFIAMYSFFYLIGEPAGKTKACFLKKK